MGRVGRSGRWWAGEGCHLHRVGPGVSWVSEGTSDIVVVSWIGALCSRERVRVREVKGTP